MGQITPQGPPRPKPVFPPNRVFRNDREVLPQPPRARRRPLWRAALAVLRRLLTGEPA